MKIITDVELQENTRKMNQKIASKQPALQSYTEVLSGNKTIKAHDAKAQFLDANGANRTITLPAENISDNIIFWFFNTASGAFDLIIQDDSPVTVITISQNEMGVVCCNGTVWKGGIMPIT